MEHELHSPGWFEEAFASVNPHPNIRKFSEEFCKASGIRGICDPGYISTITAEYLGEKGTRIVEAARLIAHLQSSFSKSNLPTPTEIETMIRNHIG